ncbi:MAG: hypothetical protein Kow001_14960 [Acidobacteriota bacterium]
MNGTKLYVGGLPYSMSDRQLEELFSAYGTVQSSRIITDRMTGRSRGFGFIEMGSQAEAQAAMDALNGNQYEGRTLTVNEAQERAPRPGGGGGGGGRREFGGGGRDRDHGSRKRW